MSSMMFVLLIVIAAIVAVAIILAQPWAADDETVTPGQGGSDEPGQELQTPSAPLQIATVVPTVSNNQSPQRIPTPDLPR
jgi:hypothetical protein